MDLDLTDAQRRWRDLAREYAQEEIRPRAAQLDREQRFPYGIAATLAELGLLGLTVPERYGGSGGDLVAYVCALEEIARAVATMQAHARGGARAETTVTPGELEEATRDVLAALAHLRETTWAQGRETRKARRSRRSTMSPIGDLARLTDARRSAERAVGCTLPARRAWTDARRRG